MSLVQKLVTEDSFDAHAVLIPAGHIGTFDTDRLNGNEKHLYDADKIGAPAMVEIAAISPTGPNPTMPQQIPPDAVQGPTGLYHVPGKILVGETTNPANERIDDRGLRDADHEAEVSATIEEIMGAPAIENNNDALVAGTVADVTADLGGKTDEQLTAMRAAETDREQPRKGVLSAIDAELDKRKTA